jgi:hypothetical protein
MNQDKIIESINKLFITKTDNYIFIYTPPKVGSTTLVTSLRVSLNKSYNIIHIHDEVMLNVLTGINDIKIIDIINYLSNIGKKIYVIDVYRTPIERKMSEYFEKISPYHFNNSDENISKYSFKKICDRFNNIFPHIENGDHYFENFKINEPIKFDFEKKYTIQNINNVSYIKLRLCDSNIWNYILSNIFKTDIVIINDYKTEDKNIGELYKKFKKEYKLPFNFLNLIKENKYFKFYYNEIERKNYIDFWSTRLCDQVKPYTVDEYKFYINLCLENQYINDLQIDHYIDNGCFCKYCTEKRKEIYFSAKSGEKNFKKIVHVDYNEKMNINKKNNYKLKTNLSRLNINFK